MIENIILRILSFFVWDANSYVFRDGCSLALEVFSLNLKVDALNQAVKSFILYGFVYLLIPNKFKVISKLGVQLLLNLKVYTIAQFSKFF